MIEAIDKPLRTTGGAGQETAGRSAEAKRANGRSATSSTGRSAATMAAMSTMPDHLPDESRGAQRLLTIVESLAVFILGAAMMNFFYAVSAKKPGGEIGAPGHDSFYHTKMAAMIPEVGLLRKFPWLQHSWFRESGDDFVSHHYGFHMLMLPFVQHAHAQTGDYLPGARWAMAAIFGANLLLFNLLLKTGGVRWRWAWIALLLLGPDQFFMRQTFIRAIGVSLMMMQLVLLMLLQRRHVWAAIAIGLYVHIYLGAVTFVPVLVGGLAFAMVLGRAGDREPPWRLVGWSVAGWAVGVLTYPYFSGMLEFLKMQIVGTGLSPDIEVGQEWLPYSDPWWFARMSGVTLMVWVAALCARLRSGPRLSAHELGLVLIQFAFLVLVLKARRFIEYWPLFATLSAAWLARPAIDAFALAVARNFRQRTRWARRAIVGFGGVWLAVGACWFLWYAARTRGAVMFMAEWPTWSIVVALLLLAPLSRIWAIGRTKSWPRAACRVVLVGLMGAVLVAAIAITMRAGFGVDRWARRLAVPPVTWAVLAAIYIAVPSVVLWLSRRARPLPPPRALARGFGGVLTALVCVGFVIILGGARLGGVGGSASCMYDLPAIRDMMAFLKKNSDPGDVIFTDDWDTFPVFFYHNSYNRYIVGLDPKFTHARRPDLWERYVRITRAQTPCTKQVVMNSETRETKRIDIRLTDIRDEFGAKFVIIDRDHRNFAEKLVRAPEFAELIYPKRRYEECGDAPYVIFRVRADGEPVARGGPPAPDAQGRLYLSQLAPLAVEQGWGGLREDKSVEDAPLRLRGRRFARGLGTHAPSRLAYDIPRGYAWFEAQVGVDDETNGAGSVTVAVYLDGTSVFESPRLTGTSDAMTVRIPLGGARQIMLRADTTDDGERFDHVDWADARLIRDGDSPDSNASDERSSEQP